jgi:hypothetical protein
VRYMLLTYGNEQAFDSVGAETLAVHEADVAP